MFCQTYLKFVLLKTISILSAQSLFFNVKLVTCIFWLALLALPSTYVLWNPALRSTFNFTILALLAVNFRRLIRTVNTWRVYNSARVIVTTPSVAITDAV